MDINDFHAVYEHGILKPSVALPFQEAQSIHLKVLHDQSSESGFPEEDIYRPEFLNIAQIPFTWGEVTAAFAKIPAGEIEADMRREREGRYE